MAHKDLENIEAFFEGRLNEKERADFDKKRRDDTGFAESVELFELSKAVIQANHRDQLIQDTQGMMDAFEKRRSGGMTMTRVLSIAAAVVGIGLFFWLFPTFSTSSGDQVFADHFEMPIAPGVRGDNFESQWTAAADNYQNGNFDLAIDQFNTLLGNEEFKLKDRTNYFLGISHILNEAPLEGIEALKNVSSSSSYYQEAIWNIALAYFKSGDMEAGKKALQEIANSEVHYKRKVAKEILQDIE